MPDNLCIILGYDAEKKFAYTVKIALYENIVAIAMENQDNIYITDFNNNSKVVDRAQEEVASEINSIENILKNAKKGDDEPVILQQIENPTLYYDNEAQTLLIVGKSMGGVYQVAKMYFGKNAQILTKPVDDPDLQEAGFAVFDLEQEIKAIKKDKEYPFIQPRPTNGLPEIPNYKLELK